MNEGYLSQYFIKVAAKRLSAVEADPQRSNQHEFNGNRELKKVLGTGSGEKIQFPAIFVWIGQENEAISSEGSVTWYDARREHPTRSEYRLYFPTTDVTGMANPGDMIFIARRRDDTLMIILAAADSTIENQLLWLFGLRTGTGSEFSSQIIEDKDDREVDFVVRFIFDELGIEVEEPEADYLDHLLARFKGIFPGTRQFSLFARSAVAGVDPVETPDDTVMAWMDYEEKLFRRLERHVVERGLNSGFSTENFTGIESFTNFSLNVQNRRKSRAELALKNHLETIFVANKVLYNRSSEAENESKPDFLFPNIQAYRDSAFSETLLTMLGVRNSCNEGWKQILSQAPRIPSKHLFTLEPGISEDQTYEMRTQKVQLVLPAVIHDSFKPAQRQVLIRLADFLDLVKSRQRMIP